MQIGTGCICFQMSPQSTWITADIDFTFLHCVLSNVISNFLNEQRKTLWCVFQVVPQVACSKGCIITLVASIDFSPLCDFKCILKLAGQVDAKLHWLHLFDLSPLCLFKSHWMHWFSFGTLSEKKTGLCGKNSQTGGGVWPKPTSWCLLTKLFLACQNDSEVLKHVLQKGGRWYLINFNT